MRKPNTIRGLTMVETVIGAAVFAMIALSVYQGYALIFKLINSTRAKTAAFELAEERIEIIRNMPYANIGIVSGIPAGTLARVATYTRSGFNFQATTTVRNVDNTFDGVIGGIPNDLSPADHKLVELEIGCATCVNFPPIIITTTASPRSLETTTGNGAIFVQVIDANGAPVEEARVSIIGQGTSTVSINEDTNNSGLFQLVDVPPANFGYALSVTKTGYSSGQTYTPGAVGNPNPVQPHATVVQGVVTQTSFSIDKLSSVNVRTVTETCAPVASIPFTITGSKKIGTSPDVYKFISTTTTDGSGVKLLNNMEWDTYNLTVGSAYDIGGTMPFLPFLLSPDSVQELIVVPKTAAPNSFLVRVKDSATGLPVAGATVTITKSGVSQILQTSRGFFKQTNWAGGPGEIYSTGGSLFSSSDGWVEYASSTGEIALRRISGNYVSSGSLISSWFDVGTASTTLYSLEWLPVSQPGAAGTDSVKFQLESTTNIASTSTGFVGPDGTGATYYTTPGATISSVHTNKRYVRYKVFLTTASPTATPLVSDVSMTFGTDCVPFGQVFFSGLSSGTYTLDITAPGYTSYSGSSNVITGENATTINLDPL